MKLKGLFVLYVLSLILIGCISEFDAKLPFNNEILVIDGSITENTAIFYLSKSFPLDCAEAPEESFNIDAKLTIIGSNGYQSPPATNMGKGEYRIVAGELSNDVEYGIKIEYEGDTYQSTLSKLLRTPEIDSISWIQPERNGNIFFQISTHDDTEGSRFFLWNYTEDWEITADIATSIILERGSLTRPPGYYLEPAPYYYCWKKNVSNKLLIGSTESLIENRIINKQFYEGILEDDRFSVLYCITVYQKAISKEAYEYYQSKLKFNEEMGGLFTPQPSEVKGNITCITDPSKRVIGYVETVKNTTQKRIFVSEAQITRPHPRIDCKLIPHDSVPKHVSANSQNKYGDFYNMGWRPAGGPDIRGTFPVNWAERSCVECIAKEGATKNKPDFWPNDHE